MILILLVLHITVFCLSVFSLYKIYKFWPETHVFLDGEKVGYHQNGHTCLHLEKLFTTFNVKLYRVQGSCAIEWSKSRYFAMDSLIWDNIRLKIEDVVYHGLYKTKHDALNNEKNQNFLHLENPRWIRFGDSEFGFHNNGSMFHNQNVFISMTKTKTVFCNKKECIERKKYSKGDFFIKFASF